MGTYYAVQQRAACSVSQTDIDARLEALNAQFSTYREDSAVSQFNRSTSTGWQKSSAEFVGVLKTAERVWRESGGAFDVTIGPVVNLWGFGPDAQHDVPSAEAQAAARSRTGMMKLEIGREEIAKSEPELYLDLSALAKGYAVDAIAEMLDEQACSDYLIDIGGEVRARGVNARNGPWRIGIEIPDPGQFGAIQRVLALSDVSVATSGDYRNFKMVDDKRVDHVIDARSGLPADNLVASVTVVHRSAMFADAYATTIMVLGEKEGLAFADAQGIAVYLLIKDAGAGFREAYNAAMRNYLAETNL
jgi:thiamine biosynthesis lipoprotein